METQGRVLRAEGSAAVVEIQRKSACSGNCTDCSGCAEQAVEITVLAEFPVSPGDRVTVSSAKSPVLFGLFVLFILPLVLPLGAYLLTMNSGFGGWFAAAAALLAVVMIRLLSKSRWFLEQTRPKIVNVISERGSL